MVGHQAERGSIGPHKGELQVVLVLMKDSRVKCSLCGRWMRYHPTEKTPATRRPAPHAATCTGCPFFRFKNGEVYVVTEIENFN